jgi:hypothetical protein
MGSMIYGLAPAIVMDDRVLRHVQAVIVVKLRRQESFSFSWDDEPGVEGDQLGSRDVKHGSVWVSPSSLLYFSYDGPRPKEQLNGAWLDILMQAASSSSGLRALPEPAAPTSR